MAPRDNNHDAHHQLAQQADTRRRPVDQREVLYRQQKQALPQDLTPEQYEAACRAIAKRLGI